MKDYTCLADICQNEIDYTAYLKKASDLTSLDERINLYFPFIFRLQSKESSYSKTFYLKLQKVKQAHNYNFQYRPPRGIFIREEKAVIIKQLLKSISENNTNRIISRCRIEDKPRSSDLLFLFNNENIETKKHILDIKNVCEELHNKSKRVNFNINKEIDNASKIISELNLKQILDSCKFVEHDFDCSKVIEYCKKDELFMIEGWNSLISIDNNQLITAKNLYIKDSDANINRPKKIINHYSDLERILDEKDKGRNKDKNMAMLEHGIQICIEKIEKNENIENLTHINLSKIFVSELKQRKRPCLIGDFLAKENMDGIKKGDLLTTYTQKNRPRIFFKQYFEQIKIEAKSRVKRKSIERV